MPDVTISEESAALLRELRTGLRSEHDDDRTEAALVDDAIRRVHRGFFGLPPGTGGPEAPTGPFRKWASDRPAEVLLRQVDALTFRLVQPFRYDDGARRFDVPEGDVTDLASVPRFLTWLVPRYGRHTLAALLHDHLQDDTAVSSVEADVVFRDAMADTGVPVARRWLMWSAVAVRTEWVAEGLRRLRAAAWAVAFALVALVVWSLLVVGTVLGGGPGLVAGAALVGAALAAPVALSWVFGRAWRVGAISGLALVLVTVPAALVLLALGVYVVVERVTERLCVPRPARNPSLTRHLSDPPEAAGR